MRSLKNYISFGALGLALALGSGWGTASADATTTGPFTIQVMKHVCPDITGISGYNALTQGMDPLGAFIALEVACPTTALPGDDPADNASSAPRMNFEFSVTGPDGLTQTLQDAGYVQHKLCETDVSSTTDFDNNGTTTPSACLDASYYDFMTGGTSTDSGSSSPATATSSYVYVSETDSGDGFHFGTFLFTPQEIMPNNDADTWVSTLFGTSTGTTTVPDSSQNSGAAITLDMSKDNDGMVMLHVFNFANTTSTDTGTSTGTTTPDEDDDDDNNGGGTGGGVDVGSILERIRARLHADQGRIDDRLSEVQDRLDTIFENFGR